MTELNTSNLPRYSWGEIQKKISSKTPFEAISPLGTALIRVRAYEPLMALAVHAGHLVREELQSKMMIEEDSRRYEEDRFSEQLIAHFPIQMVALDSRYEYDLNRPRDQAVYLKPFQSWGKKVWINPPTRDELVISYQKHEEFHELLDFLLEQFEAIHGRILIFDVHSYNYRRPNLADRADSLPQFDVGTTQIDSKRDGALLGFILQELRKADFSPTANIVRTDALFKGDGEIPTAIARTHPESLLIPLEIKKTYMDELLGAANASLVDQISAFLFAVAKRAQAMLSSPPRS